MKASNCPTHAGSGLQSASKVGFGCQRPARPNPSIEGTSNIRLRLPLAAPHVKR
jgi:hypothetical protein